MHRLTPRELKQYSALEFERWLTEFFNEVYSGSDERVGSAMIFTEIGITPRSVLHVLNCVFELLDGPSREAVFHESIGSALRHARLGRFPEQAMRDLITLLGTTRAFSQLSALDTVLGTGEWGDGHPSLFRFALSSLRTLRTGHEAYHSCQRLVTAPRFPKAYIFDAFEVLIGGRPDLWAENLVQLSAPLLEVLETIERQKDREQRADYVDRFQCMMEALMESVSVKEIAEGLAELTRHEKFLTPVHPVGRTLYFLAAGVTDRRIVIDAESGRLVFRARRSSIVQPVTNISGAGEVFFMNTCRTDYLTTMQADLDADIERERDNARDSQTWQELQQVNANLEHLFAPPSSGQLEAGAAHE
jgi:hypothetical protein